MVDWYFARIVAGLGSRWWMCGGSRWWMCGGGVVERMVAVL